MSDRGEPRERWTSGSAYESYVGRWSRKVALEFVRWLDVPRGSRWLDVGCGTAALTSTVVKHARPAAAVGLDPSVGFVSSVDPETLGPRTDLVLGDAVALPFADSTFDSAVSGLVLNFVPDPARMVSEMARVVRTGGVVALYVWDYGGEMQMMRHFWSAAAALDPAARELDEGARFPVCEPASLARLFEAAGLARVGTRAIDIPTVFQDFEDYWAPFLGGTGTAPTYVSSLGEERRTVLRNELRSRLPIASDGTIRLIGRANAVRGTR